MESIESKRKVAPKKQKAKSDVSELMRVISSLRPLEELTISNERLLSKTKSTTRETDDTENDSDSLITKFSSFRSVLSRKGSGRSSLNDDAGMISLASHQDSLASEFSLASKRSQRELIHEIEKRAKKNKPPPEFLQPIDQLDPSLISWNRKLIRNNTFHGEPQVNIIGCLHPVELVLAKADQRLRKRQRTLKQKQKHCEERTKEIDEAIKWKFTRAERYAAMVEQKQRQVAWIRAIYYTTYLEKLRIRFQEKLEIQIQFQKIAKYARLVTKAFYRWYRRHIWKKLHGNYATAFDQVRGRFAIFLRIYRKRRAINRIKQFFTDYKGHHKMNLVVHKYLSSVKTVQRIIRDFLACKQAKIMAIGKLWDKYEIQYIRKKLEQRKRRSQEMQIAKRSSDQKLSEMEHRQFNEMKQQAQLWARIDSKVSTMVNQLKSQGVIVEEDENEVIQRLMLPIEIRMKCLRWIVERVRKEFYAGQRNILKKRIEMDATFKEHHALALLRGQNENLNRIINEKFNKKLVNLQYKPFMLFRSLDRKLVWDKMKEAHHLNETFKIHIRNVEQDRKKSVLRA